MEGGPVRLIRVSPHHRPPTAWPAFSDNCERALCSGDLETASGGSWSIAAAVRLIRDACRLEEMAVAGILRLPKARW
jgi:hypothetical protein